MGITIHTSQNVLSVEHTGSGVRATTCSASVPIDQIELTEKKVFEADYFTLGEHEVIHEVYVQKPYAGSETHGWRIFVNYEGPEELYGEVEEPLIISFTLTFV